MDIVRMWDSPRTILITGAAGFVGHHMVEHFLKNTNDKIIGVDCLNYSGTWDRLRNIDIDCHTRDCVDTISAFDHPRFTPMVYNFSQPAEVNLVKELKDVTHVLHLGAESHVDLSIKNPMRFCVNNVNGTVNILNLARQLPNLELFVYFSTDEVFGPAPFDMKGGYKENDRHDPKNPYAASKSAAEQFVTAFANTYDLPCITTRQMNIIGERQHPEKFIPLCIKAAITGDTVKIHSTPDRKKAGMRHYIHARNVADAHLFLLNVKPWLKNIAFPKEMEAYHVVGELELDNLTLANTIDEYVGYLAKDKYVGMKTEMIDFHSSRPGHDLRYALDGSKMKGLGWQPPKTFHQSLKKTIEWFLKDENSHWLK